jgi:hypothetical protein
MDELLEELVTFSGEITIRFHKETGHFEITAERGRVYCTTRLANSHLLTSPGDIASLLAIKAIRAVKQIPKDD